MTHNNFINILIGYGLASCLFVFCSHEDKGIFFGDQVASNFNKYVIEMPFSFEVGKRYLIYLNSDDHIRIFVKRVEGNWLLTDMGWVDVTKIGVSKFLY